MEVGASHPDLGKSPWYPLEGCWMVTRPGLDAMTKGKKSYHCLRQEMNPNPPAHSLVTVLTEL
jgi:hypothetical protein